MIDHEATLIELRKDPFFRAVEEIDHSVPDSARAFVMQNLICAVKYLKEKYPGKCVDDFDYSELIEAFGK